MSKLLDGVGHDCARLATTDGTHGLRHQAEVRAQKSTIGWSVCRLPRGRDRDRQRAARSWIDQPCFFPSQANPRFASLAEVQQLQNIAELMDSILTRSHLTDQVALQTRLEHLAMMSRGLAHDLKNLITPVSSFLVHTDGRYPPDSAEADVHAAARRSVRIMTDYVREALFFAETLKPRFEPTDLAAVFDRVRETTATRATSHGVALATILDYPGSVVADGVLLQRMLANLVSNAIDASARGQEVHLAAGVGRSGWFRLQVSDRGSGIAPELLDRIFDPYFTTKEFGEDVRGFGLGLTIARKIAGLHGGTIRVESPPGRGTTFTVELPVTQPGGAATDSTFAPAPVS